MPAERAGQEEVGGFQHWAQIAWLLLGLAVERPWSALGGPFLISLLFFGTNGLRKWSSGHVGPPFLGLKLFSHSVGAIFGHDYCKLVRQWVWFVMNVHRMAVMALV